MTSSESHKNPEKQEQAWRQLLIHTRNVALRHLDAVGPRTARSLQCLDLLYADTPGIGEDIELEVLQNDSHPRREKIHGGPLLLYRKDGQETIRIIVELPVLLLSSLYDRRIAALGCIERSVGKGDFDLTPNTKRMLGRTRKHIKSKNRAEWIPAAIQLTDALNEDVLAAIQGTRQSLVAEPVLENMLDQYSPRVMEPSQSSLGTVKLEVTDPENEHKQLTSVIAELVTEVNSLSELCSRYWERLGFLPLAPEYGLVRAIDEWASKNPVDGVWGKVWQWADSAPGPVPVFHACMVFVVHPDLIPDGKIPELWHRIIDVVGVSVNAEDEKEGASSEERWKLRQDLAKHYAYHIESRLPDSKSANIACYAWWFAEQVANIFPDSPDAAAFYRENWVTPALQKSSHTWLIATPPVENSLLRYYTQTVPHPWAVSLLCVMGQSMAKLRPGEQAPEIRERFDAALDNHMVAYLPFPTAKPKNPTYAAEYPLAKTVATWAKMLDNENKEVFDVYLKRNRELNDPKKLCAALKEIDSRPVMEQLAIGLVLKSKGYTAPEIAQDIWQIVSDETWRKNVLAELELHVQGLIVEALAFMQVHNREQWQQRLPHFICELCEQEDDEDRRQQLFYYVIYTSMASDTVSAVRRLVRGDHKAKFAKFADEYRERAEEALYQYPPWVAARLRELIVNMHVL